MRAGLDLNETDGCCGVTQVTNFSWVGDACAGYRIIVDGKTEEEAYRKLFDALMAYDPTDDRDGRVFQIWFMRPKNYQGVYASEFLAEPFRRLIETIPNVVNLGEFENYKSGNKIQGYQWENLN